jgi:hypothetical protein
MKLILSRKGFDASYGGMASPILPDGTLVPLPIPSSHDRHTFADADLGCTVEVDRLLADLSRDRFRAASTVHLDPDLARPTALRPPGWRPAFGQTHTAQSHLSSQGVGGGDLFLFFGWFRAVELHGARWRYSPEAPDLHVIFGWLEVEEVLPITASRSDCLARYPWILDHPHAASPGHYTDARNTLYISRASSGYCRQAAFGAGRFSRYSEHLRLTRAGSSRSIWSLPSWFMPCTGRKPLTYHGDPRRWELTAEGVILRSVAKGQEFVLDCDDYAEADQWLASILNGQPTV